MPKGNPGGYRPEPAPHPSKTSRLPSPPKPAGGGGHDISGGKAGRVKRPGK